MSMNLVAIRRNGLTITDQAETSADVAAKAYRWRRDPFYCHGNNPVVRVFFGTDQDGLTELPLNESER